MVNDTSLMFSFAELCCPCGMKSTRNFMLWNSISAVKIECVTFKSCAQRRRRARSSSVCDSPPFLKLNTQDLLKVCELKLSNQSKVVFNTKRSSLLALHDGMMMWTWMNGNIQELLLYKC